MPPLAKQELYAMMLSICLFICLLLSWWSVCPSVHPSVNILHKLLLFTALSRCLSCLIALPKGHTASTQIVLIAVNKWAMEPATESYRLVGPIFLYVCLWNLWSHLLHGTTSQRAGAYRIDPNTLILMSFVAACSAIVMAGYWVCCFLTVSCFNSGYRLSRVNIMARSLSTYLSHSLP